MAGRTPNLDKIAKEGMLFTDYYAEASCTAGRANFITGELPIRTGMTTVGQAGAPIGIPAEAVTIATILKSMGYATGQFGKNHLGDRNEFLPTVHGFDEFFGYLYHLDAMEDPAHPNYPQNMLNVVGPRGRFNHAALLLAAGSIIFVHTGDAHGANGRSQPPPGGRCKDDCRHPILLAGDRSRERRLERAADGAAADRRR
jgi:arylsulfatase A-like enzyme